MRYPIGYLDLPSVDGRVVEAAGFTWAEEPLPLRLTPTTGQGHDGAVLLGTVTEIEVNDGEVSAVLSHPVIGFGPGFDLDDAEWAEGPYGLRVVKRARLRAVTLTRNPAWPRLVIQ